MARGLVIAVGVTAIWVFLQNLLMHFWPANNRFRAMVGGYMLSLPLVSLGYYWLPEVPGLSTQFMPSEAWSLGLIHAHLAHLLLFFLYGEFFYYVERSVTLRLFVELLKFGEAGASLHEIQHRYNVDEMVQRRLDVLCERGFIEKNTEGWCLKNKGKYLARLAAAGSWLFQFKGQHERT